MKNSLFVIILFVISFTNASAQFRKYSFEKIDFSLYTRELPLKVLSSDYKTVNFKFKTYDAEDIDSLDVKLMGYSVSDDPDLLFILYTDRIFDMDIKIENMRRGYQWVYSYICPVTFELFDKQGTKIDGRSLKNGITFQEKYVLKSPYYYETKELALEHFEYAKDTLLKNISEKRIINSLPEFEKEINALYGFRVSEAEKGRLLCLRKKKNDLHKKLYKNTFEAAELLNSIHEKSNLKELREASDSILLFYRNELNIESKENDILSFIGNYNLMVLSYHLELFDDCVQYADKLGDLALANKYKKKAIAKKKLLKKYKIHSFCFSVDS